MTDDALRRFGAWQKNIKEAHDDWGCPRCRKYNQAGARQCGFCGTEPAASPFAPAPLVNLSAPVNKIYEPVESGLCVRNRTNRTWWFYTEQTAPLQWVQLRSGEACDISSFKYAIYTIGARLDEPNPAKVIGEQLGFVAAIGAGVLMLVLPDPGSKVAVVAYLAGATLAVGGLVGGGVVLGISNASNLKQVGVQTKGGVVFELTDELVSYTTLTSGTKVGNYSYSWTDVTESVGWNNRAVGFNWVQFGEDRGNLDDLVPIDNKIIQEIRHHDQIGALYMDSIHYWKAHNQLQEHVFPFGGKGGSEEASVYAATAGGEQDYGFITEVRVWASKFVDGLQVKYNNQTQWERVTSAGHCRDAGIFHDSNSSDHGLTGGYFKCPPGQYISRIKLKHDKYIVTLQFITNKGVVSQVFGGGSGDGQYETEIPKNPSSEEGWIGYRCSFVHWLDSMTFVIGGKKPLPADQETGT